MWINKLFNFLRNIKVKFYSYFFAIFLLFFVGIVYGQSSDPNIAVETTEDVAKTGMVAIWENSYIQFLKDLIIAIAIVFALIVVSVIIKGFVRKKILAHSFSSEDEYAMKIGDLISDIVFYCLLIFSIFMGFEYLGFDVSIILGGLTFGIGFAFKEILSNMISGILILTTKEFKLGDIIEIEGDYAYFGRIEQITIRYTVIRSLDMRKIVIPNLVMVTNPIKTYTSEELIRLEAKVSVHYDADIDNTIKLLKEAINTLDFVVERDNTKIQLYEFGDSGIELRILFYIDPNCGRGRASLLSDVNRIVLDTLRKNNINIPYPHQVLTVDSNDKNLLASMLYVKKK